MSRGSVRQDVKRGTWLLVVDVPSPDGTRRQHRERGFQTKKAAQHRLTEVLAAVDRGGDVRPARVTLGEFLVDEWLPARARSLRPSTLASCEVLIGAYVVPRLGGVAVAGVDRPMLNRFYGDLLERGRGDGQGLSAKSVREHRRAAPQGVR